MNNRFDEIYQTPKLFRIVLMRTAATLCRAAVMLMLFLVLVFPDAYACQVSNVTPEDYASDLYAAARQQSRSKLCESHFC